MIRCPRLRTLPRDTSGQALLETVIAFPVLLFFVLVVMELSLLYNAKQLANHAAFSAARTAAVYGIDSTAKRHFAAAMIMSSIAPTNIDNADNILKAYWLDDPDLTVAQLCSIPGFRGDNAKWLGRLANAHLRTYLPHCDTAGTPPGRRKHVVVNVTSIYRCRFLPLGSVWGQAGVAAYCDTLEGELGAFQFHPSWKHWVTPPLELIRNAWRWNIPIHGRAVTDYWGG
jgi:hypothetical protein